MLQNASSHKGSQDKSKGLSGDLRCRVAYFSKQIQMLTFGVINCVSWKKKGDIMFVICSVCISLYFF